MAKSKDDLEKTKRLMGALLRMPPKQHSEMKLGKKASAKPTQNPLEKKPSRGASSKAKSA
jgi:hypothetical protein